MLIRSLLVALALTSAAAGPALAGGVDEARTAMQRGDYDGALDALAGASEADRQSAALLRARVLELTGRADEALEILRREAAGSRATPASVTALGRWLIERGAWDEAVAVLDPAAESDDPYLPARYWRALAFDRLGRTSRARLDLEDFVRAYNRGRANDPELLMYVAMACHRLGQYADANDAFREALALRPDDQDIRLRWAELFMEKYRPDEAVTLLDEVLTANPSHPDALALRARAELDLTYDVAESRRLAEAGLAVRRDSPDARETLAAIAIDDQDYDQAVSLLEAVLRDRPRRSEALGLLGGVYYLLDDEVAFAATEERARAADPRPAEFYHEVGELAVNNFRYAEALDLHRRAVEIDAGFWPAYVSLGIGFSRAGDDARALQFLRRAFEADPFNVQAYNMVELWETALADYRYVDDELLEGVRYRFHRDERAVLEWYVPPVVRATWQEYVRRYDREPDMPLSVEVFADEATFGIRSVGLPFVGLHGICFGHVVTARSPGEGDFNWRQVIEHELSHVFSLDRSNARVPRWFTEGLAEYDTVLSRREWRREEDLAIVRALQRDALVGVMGLNHAFVGGDRPDQVLEAYFQSSLVVGFIGQTWGYDALLAMLDAWAASKQTPEVFTDVLGLTTDAFDERFEAAMRERYADLLGLFEPAVWWFADADRYRAAAAEHPDDATAVAELAWAEVAAGDPDAARAAVTRALALDAREPLANLLGAHLAWQLGAWGEARARYEAVLAAGVSSYATHAALGELAAREGRVREAVDHLVRAHELFPNDAGVVARLAEIHEDAGDAAEATRWRVRLADLDEHDAATALELAARFEASGDLARALAYAERASNVDPFHPSLHALYGRLAHAAGQWDLARRELELDLVSGPRDRSATLVLLAEVYDALGLTEDAARTRRELGR